MQVKCTSCGASQNISEAKNCDFCGNLIELESATNNSLNSDNSNEEIKKTKYEKGCYIFLMTIFFIIFIYYIYFTKHRNL